MYAGTMPPAQQYTAAGMVVPPSPAAPAAAASRTPPPDVKQLKRQRPDQDEQQQQKYQHHPDWQQLQQGHPGFGDEPGPPPAQRRRLSNEGNFSGSFSPMAAQAPPPDTTASSSSAAAAAAGMPQPQLPFQPQQQAQQGPTSWPSLDLDAADGGPGSYDEGSSGLEAGEEGGGWEPPHQRRRTGETEYRLVLPTPLPPAIHQCLPSPAWASLPPSHPANLAWAVVPYTPQPQLAQLAGASEACAAEPSGSGGSRWEGLQRQEGLSAPSQARRPQLRFDHERPLPDMDVSMASNVVAAPAFLIEELSPRAAAAATAAAAAQQQQLFGEAGSGEAGGGEAMEE